MTISTLATLAIVAGAITRFAIITPAERRAMERRKRADRAACAYSSGFNKSATFRD